MIPRFLHEIYAHRTGHFWLPCPICGRYFGGHEAAEISLMSTASAGKLVCLKCNEKARHLNEKLFRDNPDAITERKVKNSMSQLIVCLVLLLVLSRWDKPGKKKRPNYTRFQGRENLRNLFK